MLANRRTILAAGLGIGLMSDLGDSVLAHEQAERFDPTNLTKSNVPTPALILDLDAFESNLKTMSEHCRRAGCGFRPHAKTHKCPEIAKRQMAVGANGICAATVGEA